MTNHSPTGWRSLPIVQRLRDIREALRGSAKAEIAELHAHLTRLDRERLDLVTGSIEVQQERDALKQHIQRLEAQLADVTVKLRERVREVWAPPGHFYSPIVDPADPRVRRACELDLEPDAVGLDQTLMLHTLERIAFYYPDLAFPVEKKAGSRYFYENTAFSYADAITFFGMLREYQPKRLIEAGSGFSSCVAMDTNDKFFGGDIETTFVDPYPETLEGLLDVDDPYRARIRRMALQDAPIEWFEALQAGDILFLDSSHVAKTGSDVNDYFFRILPKLQSGVVIHIHDILFPYEYPAAWVLDENRSWNEIYMLRTFLQYNQAFEVIFLNDFMYRKYARMAQLRMPLCLKQTGGSIWMRKR